MEEMNNRMQNALDKRQRENALRLLLPESGKVDFVSNDYLGFARNPDLKNRILLHLQNLKKLGSGGSRLLTGNSDLVENLEKQLAKFHSAPAGLFFNSGYDANAGIIPAISTKHDLILFDALSHASIREGVRLSLSKSFAFRHNDMEDLERLLQNEAHQKFIITESVFSMDGDMCPLHEIVLLAKKYNAAIILDEAHATGVIGLTGEGLAQALGLQDDIFARIHTFGKAIGANGAVVLGSEMLRSFLINFCKTFIYTTAPGNMQLIAVEEAYLFLQQQPEIIKHLQLLIQYFKQTSIELHLPFIASDSAIQCIIISGNRNVKECAEKLQASGFDVRPILSPTVPEGAERLRICLHVFNTADEINMLLYNLKSILK